MAKEQRSNKEKRKPKQDKVKSVAPASPFAPAPGMTKGKGVPAKKR